MRQNPARLVPRPRTLRYRHARSIAPSACRRRHAHAPHSCQQGIGADLGRRLLARAAVDVAQEATLWLLSDDRQSMDGALNHGNTPAVLESLSVPITQSVVGMVASTGVGAASARTTITTPWRRTGAADTLAMIAAPVLIRGRLAGVVSAINPARRRAFLRRRPRTALLQRVPPRADPGRHAWALNCRAPSTGRSAKPTAGAYASRSRFGHRDHPPRSPRRRLIRSYRVEADGESDLHAESSDDAGDVYGHGTAVASIVRRFAPAAASTA